MIITPTTEPILGALRQAYVPSGSWRQLETCPICGRDEALADLATVEADSAGPVVASCGECEHLFKRRHPTSEWLSEYYAHEWDARGQAAVANGMRVRPRDKILRFCAEYLPAGARVLDLGAGFGNDVLAFHQSGYRAHALESSEHRAHYIEGSLGIPCVVSPFETAELPPDLDLIFSNHVLEHIADPRVVIEKAAAVLPEGGLLYSALPNCLSFEHPLQFLYYAPHQSGFSLKSLRSLLSQHGFEVVKAVATRELKVLARKSGTTTPAVEHGASRSRFAKDTEQWLAQGFGGREGSRTLVWWRGRRRRPDRCYEGAVVPGGERTYRAVRATAATLGRMPRRLQQRSLRVLPPFYKGQVRMVHVDVRGDFELPILVQHDATDPPIWVK
jgi:SAM-dependent methyltransferase